MEALCRLVSIFPGGLPGGSLPPPRNNTDEVFNMWTQKIRTMSTTECQRLADAGDPERIHEFALRWPVRLLSSSPDVPRAERYWARFLSSLRAAKRSMATPHAHLVWYTGILFGAEGRSIHIRDCMMAGRTLERLRYGEHMNAFAKWKHLWAAYDARVAELQAEQDEEAKRFVRPSRYTVSSPRRISRFQTSCASASEPIQC
ncbi:hypothetical protein B0H13DRAFT_2329397 [Mycena leptocephala]|nr:hypothetical protein B0H13DRAFT_2329397 [Mycena leptocephala]